MTTIFRIRAARQQPKLKCRSRWGRIWFTREKDRRWACSNSKTSMLACRLHFRGSLPHLRWCFSSLYLSNYILWWTFLPQHPSLLTREEYSQMLVETSLREEVASSRREIRGFRLLSVGRASTRVSNSSNTTIKMGPYNIPRWQFSRCPLPATRVSRVAFNSSRWLNYHIHRLKHFKINSKRRHTLQTIISWKHSNPWHPPILNPSYLKLQDFFKEDLKANLQ